MNPIGWQVEQEVFAISFLEASRSKEQAVTLQLLDAPKPLWFRVSRPAQLNIHVCRAFKSTKTHEPGTASTAPTVAEDALLHPLSHMRTRPPPSFGGFRPCLGGPAGCCPQWFHKNRPL